MNKIKYILLGVLAWFIAAACGWAVYATDYSPIWVCIGSFMATMTYAVVGLYFFVELWYLICEK